jgi:hypothetical protein
MDLRELRSSIATMMASVIFLYLALGAVDSYSGEDHARIHKIALSSNAAQYIFLRQ